MDRCWGPAGRLAGRCGFKPIDHSAGRRGVKPQGMVIVIMIMMMVITIIIISSIIIIIIISIMIMIIIIISIIIIIMIEAKSSCIPPHASVCNT